MNYNKKSIEDVDVSGKRVLCRCDFNVPTKDGKITSDKRIVAALPTIQYLMNHDAKVILCSHMGKPKGEWKPELSLRVVAQRLSELLGKEVLMAADVVGEDARAKAAALQKRAGLLSRFVCKRRLRHSPPCPLLHRRCGRLSPGRLRLSGAEGSGRYGQSPGRSGASLCGHFGRCKGF